MLNSCPWVPARDCVFLPHVNLPTTVPQDSNGVRLTHDVSFTLEATAPLHIGTDGDQDEQQQQQQQRKRQRKEPTITSADGRLEVPALAVGRGPVWWRRPLLLTLRPQAQDDAAVDSATGPLVILLQVEPHRCVGKGRCQVWVASGGLHAVGDAQPWGGEGGCSVLALPA